MENMIKLTSKQVEGGYLNFSLIAPKFNKRTPLNICFVIDVSTRFTEEIENIDPSYSLPFEQVLQNAIQPLLHPLTEQDKISIIQPNVMQCGSGEFLDEQAVTIFSPQAMNEEGKNAALQFISNIQISSETNNTIDSLERALALLRDSTSAPTCNSSPTIILISDVKFKKTEEISTSESFISIIKEFIAKNRILEGISINTFGLSQNVDSFLLVDLAKEFSGQFAYLEDFSTPEKALSKLFSNILCSFSRNISFNISLEKEGLTFYSPNPVSPSLPNSVNDESTKLSVSVGPVQYYQTRDIIVRLSEPLDANTAQSEVIAKVTIIYESYDEEKNSIIKKSQSHEITYSNLPLKQNSVEVLRLNFVDFMLSNIKKYQNGIQSFAVSGITNLANILEKNVSLSPYIKELYEIVTLHLQTTFSNETTFKKNKNTLLSLVRGHLLQSQSICDSSLEIYAHKLFKGYVAMIEEIHSKLPVPMPSLLKKKSSNEDYVRVKSFELYEVYECAILI